LAGCILDHPSAVAVFLTAFAQALMPLAAAGLEQIAEEWQHSYGRPMTPWDVEYAASQVMAVRVKWTKLGLAA